jgi:hypothetical protein
MASIFKIVSLPDQFFRPHPELFEFMRFVMVFRHFHPQFTAAF